MHLNHYLEQPLIILAPMAGITDLPFRLICKTHGADIVYSEMVSATGIFYNRHLPVEKNKSLLLAATCSAEQPMHLQLFGCEPEHFAYSARLLSGLPPAGAEPGLYRPSGIDINFGCPVKKVMKQGCGCSLMRDPALARKIIEAVLANTSLPVSIKIRTGIERHTAEEFLDAVADQDWQTVMIHGRTFAQGFTGNIDSPLIKSIKEKFPNKTVIANGGVYSPEQARQVLEETNADGIGIARGAWGNPWIFSQAKEYLLTGTYKKTSLDEIKKTALEHARLLYDSSASPSREEFRKHLAWYFKGLNNAKQTRNRLLQVSNFQDIQNAIAAIE